MILNIIIKKVLPILTLGIGFSFAIIVGFSNVEIIPLHINIHGEVDNYGSKWELFILPAIALLIYLLMWWLERNPQLYNFPNSKKHSRKEQEKIGVELISWLKVITVLMLVLIEILLIVKPDLILWTTLPFVALLLYVCIKYTLKVL
ncbi:DUF1648 domain-containing protein [Prevotella intermedia]|uniref:DUF1648 domain-containing protein n=1 Tax=Prevotella intermedia TaxID=28131 RepID=A0A1P8JLT3_PREIN|nr:DUF1648 domain-containing protein [Prevotella intermedia]AFJ09071.1 PF07853 family protein [Prevotella intermedia 17]APW34686.1 hypothetical protein BWX40_07505 [Prevotella intermedia]ATV30889.1 DUF1648 domain-containing protein [Prevotella intermedia]PJI22860.1 DUF1648 domain-containing protein [Prevotella intermedia]BAR95597.1 hypothetical protein PI172_0869 [Prevotella intermedia]